MAAAIIVYELIVARGVLHASNAHPEKDDPDSTAYMAVGLWYSFECRTIGKAEFPGLSRLEGLDDGVVVLFPMFAGVTVLRVVATTDYTAGQAVSEMNPSVALCDAFFTDV